MFVEAPSLAQAFFKRVELNPQKTAILQKRSGVWQGLAWKQVEDKVYAYARVLEASGVARGDRVAIFAQTRPEWTFADLAILSLGAITIPIYASVTEDDVYEILANSGASTVITENSKQVDKVGTVAGRLSQLKTVFSLSPHTEDRIKKIEALAKEALNEAEAREVRASKPRKRRGAREPSRYQATRSLRLFTPPARPANPKASSSLTAIFSQA